MMYLYATKHDMMSQRIHGLLWGVVINTEPVVIQ